MKYEDLTLEMRKTITDATKTSLLRLGINVDVYLSSSERKSRYGDYVFINTSSFNTTPVIYKSCYVYGDGCFVQVKNADTTCYDLNISINYGFTYFSGGTNGVSIGNLRFRVFEDKIIFFGMELKN